VTNKSLDIILDGTKKSHLPTDRPTDWFFFLTAITTRIIIFTVLLPCLAMLRESVPDQEKDWVHLGTHTSGNGESDFVIDSLDTDEHCSFGYLSNVLKHISFLKSFLSVFS
jgi:hypothetical protein